MVKGLQLGGEGVTFGYSWVVKGLQLGGEMVTVGW